jgi:phospholipase/carboxylesterase
MELDVYTIDGRGEPERLLFLMHGYSANEYHLAALGPLMDPEARFLVAAPRAPLSIPPRGAAWWDVAGGESELVAAMRRAAVELADDTIDRVCEERGMQRNEAVIGGFSQGCALALAIGYRRSDRPRPAGVIALSGSVLADDAVDWDVAAAANVPVFIGSGTTDAIMSAERTQAIVDELAPAGVAITRRTYEGMAHDICLEELADIRDWLADR